MSSPSFIQAAQEQCTKSQSRCYRERDEGIVISRGIIKTAKIRGEWYVDVEKPESLIQDLRKLQVVPDIFTFWQRLPNGEPRYPYFFEWDNVTAIPITSYQDWWTNRTDSNTRRAVKKAKKQGVDVRVIPFNDDLLSGIAEIFNEVRVRQGKRMRHYGKSPEQLRREYLPELERTTFMGAFFENRLIGFIMLVDAGRYANIAQIMSKVKERGRCPNNALIAEAVRVCEERRIPFLVYTKLYKQGVSEFKRRNGFEVFRLPRYYVPLTPKGRLAVQLNLHRGVVGILPDELISWLIKLRSVWYSLRYPKDFTPSGSKGKSIATWRS